MSAKTPTRKPTPRGPTSRVARQQKRRKNAPAAKPRSWMKSVAPTDQSSKQSRLITLLRAPAGGTLAQMMALTGWQAHSVRGVISGVLRKKLGLKVTCEQLKDADARRYRIVGAAAGA